ncbi:MAG: hypothetical protein ACPG9N_00005 [Miltoncostaeaceae bacterium]
MTGDSNTPHYRFVSRRVERVAEAMTSGGYDPDYPRDIISDALHYAVSEGLDPIQELRMAEHHFRSETHDPGDGINEDGDELTVSEVQA